jgi:hypothetical protein
MLRDALHSDSDLDAPKIHHTLRVILELEKNAMSVAEKLKAEGLVIGTIQALQEFLDQPQTPSEALEAMSLAELETLHHKLHREYEVRFKHS